MERKDLAMEGLNNLVGGTERQLQLLAEMEDGVNKVIEMNKAEQERRLEFYEKVELFKEILESQLDNTNTKEKRMND